MSKSILFVRYFYLCFAFILFSCIVFASIDDKTSPKAYYIARAFHKATSLNHFTCPFTQITTCDLNKYQSFDGTCNNLKNSLFGAIETPFKRFLPPAYDDGFSQPRVRSVTGDYLPSPRTVSTALNSDNSAIENNLTHAFVSFGQFLTHDIVNTAKTNSKYKYQMEFF